MSEYTRNLEELCGLSSKKDKLVAHLKKNYKENVHYIRTKSICVKKRGGQNKMDYALTEKAFELLISIRGRMKFVRERDSS
jgi:hypothetical protein